MIRDLLYLTEKLLILAKIQIEKHQGDYKKLIMSDHQKNKLMK